MTCVAVERLSLLAVAIHAEIHGHLHQWPSRRTLRFGDRAVACLAFQLAKLDVTAVRVEHMWSQTEELVELQRVTLSDQLGYPRCFFRRPLRRRVTHGARSRIRQSSMSAAAHVNVTEHTIETEVFGVFAMVELDRLWYRAAPRHERHHDRREQQHSEPE
jgi:hypothetical protein